MKRLYPLFFLCGFFSVAVAVKVEACGNTLCRNLPEVRAANPEHPSGDSYSLPKYKEAHIPHSRFWLSGDSYLLPKPQIFQPGEGSFLLGRVALKTPVMQSEWEEWIRQKGGSTDHRASSLI